MRALKNETLGGAGSVKQPSTVEIPYDRSREASFFSFSPHQ